MSPGCQRSRSVLAALILLAGLASSAAGGEAAAAGLTLRSPELQEGGTLPVDYTGDGGAATLPLEWSGAPAGTAGFALVMHHRDPEGRIKWYWVLYGIPAGTQALPRNVQGVGTLGTNSINRQIGYAPPHSKGPGPKTYTYTLYALAADPHPAQPAAVGRPELLAAIDGLVLASAELNVTYTRPAGATAAPPW